MCCCEANQIRILEVAFCAGTESFVSFDGIYLNFFIVFCAHLQCLTTKVISPSCISAGVNMF